MNTGAFGENFPYSNFHDLNMDWIIKIAKDFLDQYTHIQETIDTGLNDLQEKADALEALLQEWYDTHSEDIANQLADALNDLNAWYTQHQGYLNTYLTDSINAFNQAANEKTAESIASIPADYTTLANNVSALQDSVGDGIDPGTMIQNTAISYTGTTISANNSCASDFIAVTPGRTLKITNVLLTGSRSICGYTAEHVYTGYLYTDSTETSVQFVVPDNVQSIRVTAPVNTVPTLTYVDVVDTLWENSYITNWNKLENAFANDKTLINTDGSVVTGNAFYTYIGIPVTPGEVYIAYSNIEASEYGARRAAFYTADGTLIGSIFNYVSTIQVPANASYMNVTFSYVDATTNQRGFHFLKNAEQESVNLGHFKNAKIGMNEISGHTGINYMGARRPIIGFMLDGDYDRNSELEALFSAHGIHIGFALQYNTTFPNNSHQTYLDWEKKGHEIMVHGAYPLKGDGTYSDAESIAFIEASYATMKHYGFNVREYVAHSGYCAPQYIPTIQKYYDVGYTTDNHSGVYTSSFPELSNPDIKFTEDNPYKLWRYSMQTSTIDQMMAAVDLAISTNTMVLFYAHGRSNDIQNFTNANLEALLNYIYSKGDTVHVMKPIDAVMNFYSIRYDDII